MGKLGSYQVKDRRKGSLVGAFVVAVGFMVHGINEGNVVAATVVAAMAVGLGCRAAYLHHRWPHHISLSRDGLTFHARAADIAVSWSDLGAVTCRPWDRYGGSIDWQRISGGRVRTSAVVPDLHRMLAEVEQYAPHAPVVI